MLSQPQCFLHISANLGQARLKRLITVVFAFAAGLIAPVMLVAALCQGRDADVKLKATFGWIIVDEIQPFSEVVHSKRLRNQRQYCCIDNFQNLFLPSNVFQVKSPSTTLTCTPMLLRPPPRNHAPKLPVLPC